MYWDSEPVKYYIMCDASDRFDSLIPVLQIGEDLWRINTRSGFVIYTIWEPGQVTCPECRKFIAVATVHAS